MFIPSGLRSEGLEKERQRVQAEMDRLNVIAEDWARTGRVDMAELACRGGSS
jgi:hypothetical protein